LSSPSGRLGKDLFHHCKPGCQVTNYEAMIQEVSFGWTTFASIDIQYHSDVVLIREELLLYDFADILSSIGGSFGLFLGFSFINVIDFIFDGSRAILVYFKIRCFTID
jgi:hypothetical protein